MTCWCWSLDGQRWFAGHANEDEATAAALEHEQAEGEGLDDGGALLVWLGKTEAGTQGRIAARQVTERRERFVQLGERFDAPRVLSIREPYAHLIMHAGKDVENRNAPTQYRGRVLIHVAKTFVRRDVDETLDELVGRGWLDASARPSTSSLAAQVGLIVGQVDLVGCEPAASSKSRWATSGWAWSLANPRGLEEPIAWKGMLGLLRCPPEVARRVKLVEPKGAGT